METIIVRKVSDADIKKMFAANSSFRFFTKKTKTKYEINIRHNEDENPNDIFDDTFEEVCYITEVVFRINKNGEVTAIFPYMVEYKAGVVGCYAHIGQHSSCDFTHITKQRLATPQEYESLKLELESIDYNLKVIKRINRSKYLHFYKELLNNK